MAGGPAASWDGKDAAGKLVGNGSYTWTLTARPADGHGAGLVQSGTVKLSGAAGVRRDHVGNDGVGDLASLSSTGALAFRQGTGAGTFSGSSVVAVPFGDVNGDRCNDVLVRLSSGELRAYKPTCGKALTPSTAYTKPSTAFAQFNVLTSPGDVTGDGRPDLVARQASTGDIYLYAANSTGGITARGRIGKNPCPGTVWARRVTFDRPRTPYPVGCRVPSGYARGVTRRGPLAQLAEQRTFNPLVVGSSPTRPTVSALADLLVFSGSVGGGVFRRLVGSGLGTRALAGYERRGLGSGDQGAGALRGVPAAALE
ncbi:hypothetical protein GCM10020367_30880 [Streptomyces sannanensis]|uniref:VCBS repeat-containing protein n=1 Tax=Streptomyces sannanensis TaxID=285536 RepID=A0ABP6SBV6_9ACTN